MIPLLALATLAGFAWSWRRAAKKWGVIRVSALVAAAFSFLHAQADWTGWLNFANHSPHQHTLGMLIQGVFWLFFGLSRPETCAKAAER